ncbi:GNAT family N-acetyltransferase [Actinospica robiniae]|uniref:GNAT family N-acetyltransferase n=1 Tax=Actinospica robiniae TaxID=304901 RepID=UPI000424D07B|nr:GNAT family N-acetyltransferase [Actinospica robiniae]
MPSLVTPVIPAGRLARTAQPELPVDADLRLRPWAPGDAAAVVAAYADPDIERWHARRVKDEAEAAGLIDFWRGTWVEESGASWAISPVEGGGVFGRIALREISLHEGRAEVAYWTVPSARGRRVASRALDAVVAWAFDEIGFHRLRLLHSMSNEASCRVAVASGFEAEGVERSAVLHQDGWHDMHLHAKINTRIP